jgi:hypothetical protein
MTLDLTHTSAAARLQAFESSEVRVRLVQEARWVSHERVQRVLDELEWRYLHPVCSRMPCLLLYGDSGIGKTMAIESCCERSNVELGDIPSNAEALSCSPPQH